jgi:hypothetical protein
LVDSIVGGLRREVVVVIVVATHHHPLVATIKQTKQTPTKQKRPSPPKNQKTQQKNLNQPKDRGKISR